MKYLMKIFYYLEIYKNVNSFDQRKKEEKEIELYFFV